MNKRVVALLAVSGALAVAAAVGYAAIPAANGIISACRDGKGTLKVIDAENGATCPNNQQLVAWNQQGPQGPEGPAGTPGVSGYEWEFDYGAFSSESTKSHVLWCPAGKRALGGGGLVFGASGARVPGVVLDGSFPSSGPGDGWQVRAHEAVPTDAGWRIAVHVICADVS